MEPWLHQPRDERANRRKDHATEQDRHSKDDQCRSSANHIPRLEDPEHYEPPDSDADDPPAGDVRPDDFQQRASYPEEDQQAREQHRPGNQVALACAKFSMVREGVQTQKLRDEEHNDDRQHRKSGPWPARSFSEAEVNDERNEDDRDRCCQVDV
jgi:hypothetical protein